jgi:enoyl-CoA hydratase/carnithine racemase
MSIDPTVTYESRDGIAWLGLNRPCKRNAINEELRAEFDLDVRRGQEDARAMVVFFGHGPCFSTGLDPIEHRARQPQQVYDTSRAWHATLSSLWYGRIPVIASMHGAVIGGGLDRELNVYA